MKRALITLGFALIASLGLVLPFGDSDGLVRSIPGFDRGHGDYPAHSPVASAGEKLACLTPDLRRPRPRIG
jgi:hypothetical protein